MFCKYCGKKIEKLEQPCPHCGKEQGMLCATDGYFGILGSVIPDGSKERITEEARIEDRTEEKEEAIKIEEIREKSEKGKLLEGSGESRILDVFMNWDIRNKFANKKCLSIIAIAALLVIFIVCNIYQHRSIGELRKQVSDLEQQVAEYQESVENEDEGKVNNYNE